MSKKIYIVNANTTFVVAAEDPHEARRVAERVVQVEDHGAELEVFVDQVDDLLDLPECWGGSTLPFGTEGDLTISDILESAR